MTKYLTIILSFAFTLNSFAIETSKFSHEKNNYGYTEYYSVNDSCDAIYLKEGIVVKGKVLEINDKEIIYNSCDNQDGAKTVIDKSRVFKIEYSNGTVEVITKKPITRTTKTYILYGLLGILAGALGLLFFGIPLGIAAVLLSIIAIFTADRNKSKTAALWFIGFLLGLFDVISVFSYLNTH